MARTLIRCGHVLQLDSCSKGRDEDESPTNADQGVRLPAAVEGAEDGGEVKEEEEDFDEDDEEEEGSEEKRRADLKGGFIKGQWTREEDEKVIAYVEKFGVNVSFDMQNAVFQLTGQIDLQCI